MKRTPTLFLLAALSLSACDKAKEVSAEASVKAGKAMEKAAEAGAGAAEKSKEAATGMMEKTKEFAGDALAKTKELGGDAMDFTKEKLGIPEADGLLSGFSGLLAEAKEAVSAGNIKEKAAGLKTKWDELQAKAESTMANLAPEKQEKFKAFLATIKTKWDQLIGPAKAPE